MATQAGITELEKHLQKTQIMKKYILMAFLTFAVTAKSQEIKSLALKTISYALENKSRR
jgi:hypothetical protein